MTTTITIDTNSGHSVKVTHVNKIASDPHGRWDEDAFEEIIPPNTTKQVHVWNDRYVIIEEIEE